jgi:hypothetical protein
MENHNEIYFLKLYATETPAINQTLGFIYLFISHGQSYYRIWL